MKNEIIKQYLDERNRVINLYVSNKIGHDTMMKDLENITTQYSLILKSIEEREVI